METRTASNQERLTIREPKTPGLEVSISYSLQSHAGLIILIKPSMRHSTSYTDYELSGRTSEKEVPGK